MKLLRLLFLFILPITLRAQDTTIIKQQANIIAQATFKGDYKTIIAYTYPRLIQAMGGKEKMLLVITERMDELKKQGITGFDGSVGSPGKFYKAGDEIHCLLPEEIIIKTAAGRYLGRSYMLGISNNGGKSWNFLDVGNMPAETMQNILPNFNSELKIPPPVKPEFLAN